MEDSASLSKEGTNEIEDEVQQKIILRREARRRKILENAKNRLEMLNGRGRGESQQNERAADKRYEFSDPEVEPDVIPEFIPGSTYQSEDAGELFSGFNTETRVDKKRHFIFKYRLHIISAAAIAYLISLCGNKLGGNYSIFLPAGILIAMEFTFFREQRKINPFTNLLITLCGIQTEKANKLYHILATIQMLIVDIGILMFFFCTLTFLLTCIHDSFINFLIVK